jgi:AcrR family transcriptional regulator
VRDELTKGDQARIEILDAARQLFLSQGYHGTSMRAIAREAGDRAVAGLYNHFPTKEAIFKALIEEANPYDDLFEALEAAGTGAATGPDFVRAALREVLTIMPKHYDFFLLVQIDMREFEGQHMKHVLENTVFPRVFGLIERLQALPGLKPFEALVWIRIMASLIIGFMLTDRMVPLTIFGQLSRADWIDRLTEVLLYGLAEPGEDV